MGKYTISPDYIFLRFLCQGPQVSLHFPVTVAAVGCFDTGSHVYFIFFAQGCSQVVGWSVTCLALVRHHVIGLMTEGQELGKRYN